MAVPEATSGYHYAVGTFSEGAKDKAWFYPAGTCGFDHSGTEIAL